MSHSCFIDFQALVSCFPKMSASWDEGGGLDQHPLTSRVTSRPCYTSSVRATLYTWWVTLCCHRRNIVTTGDWETGNSYLYYGCNPPLPKWVTTWQWLIYCIDQSRTVIHCLGIHECRLSLMYLLSGLLPEISSDVQVLCSPSMHLYSILPRLLSAFLGLCCWR